MFKRFAKVKDEERWKQREFCQKKEFLDRKQEVKTPENIMLRKASLSRLVGQSGKHVE